jgi:translation initiation factor 2B subunit (eIF-2B alpha/beta/delta family)
MFKKARFNKILKDIKSIRIQGATNVAKAALKAYYLFPTKQTKAKLLKLRSTEPMLSHVLDLAEQGVPKSQILAHFKEAQQKINRQIFMLIKNNDVIFTHCHSTNVIKALIYAKKQGKKFEVYNTETRPLYQGRKTARELRLARIKVTNFIDAAAAVALRQVQNTKKVNLVLLGADALLKDAVINKVGSGMISNIAYDYKIPVYIVADSWKYASKNVKLEQRHFKEVWGEKGIHIENPAFESINLKHITAIISEFGKQAYKNFLKSAKSINKR